MAVKSLFSHSESGVFDDEKVAADIKNKFFFVFSCLKSKKVFTLASQ